MAHKPSVFWQWVTFYRQIAPWKVGNIDIFSSGLCGGSVRMWATCWEAQQAAHPMLKGLNRLKTAINGEIWPWRRLFEPLDGRQPLKLGRAGLFSLQDIQRKISTFHFLKSDVKWQS